MTTQVTIFPPDHLESLSRACSAITVDPYKNILYYIFPFSRAFFSDHHQLQSDPSQEAMMPQAPTQKMLREIQDLTKWAKIPGEVIPYIGLNYQFFNCGGPFSITKPALFMPDQHLFRRNGHSPFGSEREEENLRDNPWVFSDNETRFLIARELGQIKENSALLQLAIKVAALGAMFTIYTTPLAWPVAIALLGGVVGIYILSERLFQSRADVVGVEILKKTTDRANQIAIDTLEKMRQQNLYRREHNAVAGWYITALGNNILDFTHPYLTTRLKRLTP